MTLRVLTISKPYVAIAYRHKFELLAKDPRFTMGLICPDAWGSQKAELEPKAPSYWIKQLPIRLNGHNHFHTYKDLNAAVDAFNPDILNVEEEHYSAVTAQAFVIAKRRGIPALFYTWQNIAKTYPPPFSWIEKLVLRQAAVAVGGNQESLTILKDKGYKGPCIEIPQMGVNLNLFAPKSSLLSARQRAKITLGLSPQEFWIGFVGRLVEEKGIQILLRAVALTQLPQIRVLILGDGPYATVLRSLTQELGIGEKVTFIPAVSSSAVAAYLQALDALCLPSLTRSNWKEQFGRVLIEAMAAESVTLGSSSGEIPQVIADAGLIHKEGDIEDLSAQISHLATHPEALETLRMKAAARVRTHFTNEIIAGKFAHAFFEAKETHDSRKSRRQRS